MDYEPEDSNPREALYKRFRESLKKPVSDRYFDEDELVEIFDYAGDLGDDYCRLEVLFCGARLYPESHSLSDRRALMYMDANEDNQMAKQYVADNSGRTSALLEIVGYETTDNLENPTDALEFLLGQYDTLGDEEIIRFVDLAFDLDCYEWVIDHLPELKSKASYMPSLLYEIMNEADNRSENETVIALAEELIESEPFTPTYWVALFRAHARAGHEEDARQAFDYAQSLASDNDSISIWLGDIVFNYAPYLRREICDLLLECSNRNPDDFQFLDILCAIMAQSGNNDKAVKYVKQFLSTHPGELHPLRQLLTCNTSGTEEYIRAYYAAAGPLGSEELEEIVSSLIAQASYRSVRKLLDVAQEFGTFTAGLVLAMLEAQFACSDYEGVASYIESHAIEDEMMEMPVRAFSYMALAIISLMKTGREQHTKEMIAKERGRFEGLMAIAPLPIRMSIRNLMSLFDTVDRHPANDTLFWQYFNPYSYPKS